MGLTPEFEVGLVAGDAVGEVVGLRVGEVVGRTVGLVVGQVVGELVGALTGADDKGDELGGTEGIGQTRSDPVKTLEVYAGSPSMQLYGLQPLAPHSRHASYQYALAESAHGLSPPVNMVQRPLSDE